jgi:hypothetical protein
MTRCGDCRWWKDEGDSGECRRYPPVKLAGTWGSHLFLVNTTSTHWPQTESTDFCGEFVSKFRKGEAAIADSASSGHNPNP